MNAYIGIDLGTTGARGIVYDNDFHSLGESYNEYPLSYPGNGYVEQNAESWWSLTVAAVNEALTISKVSPSDICGLAVSSQGISFVPVNKDFIPLSPAISWLDQRAEVETTEIAACFGEGYIYTHTGKPLLSGYTLPKLIWMRKNKPEIYKAARYFLLPHDFLYARLTGIPVTDHTLASGTMLYDLEQEDWSEEICNAFAISRDRLPAIRWGGQPAGKLTKAAAVELRLLEGTPVAIGGQDQKCAALAAGLAEDSVTVSLGTAAAIEAFGQTDNCDQTPRFNFFYPGVIVKEGVVNTAGMALRWLRDAFFLGKSYRELDVLARLSLGSGNLLFFPYLSESKAVFSGLGLNTSQGEAVCAVLEGVAFEIRHCMMTMGISVDTELRVFGGGAKSFLWPEIIASATGNPVRVIDTPEAACLGAALLSAVGCGNRTVQTPFPAKGKLIKPLPCMIDKYNEKFTRYEALRQFNVDL